MANLRRPMPPPPGSVLDGAVIAIVRNGNPSMAFIGSKAACWPLCRSTYMTMKRIRGLLLPAGNRVAGVDPDRIRCRRDLAPRVKNSPGYMLVIQNMPQTSHLAERIVESL